MDYFTPALLAVVVALQVATLLQARKGGGLTRRARLREAYAARAVAYAEQMGGRGDIKLGHALACFRELDLADNGKQDYSDREARMAIEAQLGAA